LPGMQTPVIGPVFGQCAVMISPVVSSISAKNRLYRLIKMPGKRGGYL
jgi:hypothetical protein